MTGTSWAAGASRPVLDPAAGRVWLGAVHRAVRTLTPAGRVLGEVREPGPGWNYYSVVVRDGAGRSRRLLLNVPARLVAGAWVEGSPTSGPLRFCEVVGPEEFTLAGFGVATVDELEAPVRPEDVAVLAPDEQADIGYHRPDRVGDVLFNWFD